MKPINCSSRFRFQLVFALIIALLVIANHSQSYAAIYYVDSSVASSGNGQSWATAWKTLTNITGLAAGDTVYISGGSTYATSGWDPTSGTAGKPITYKIGQEAGHNGTATFNCSGTETRIPTSPYIIISGDAGDGKQHFTTTNCAEGIEPNSNIRVSYTAFGEVNTLLYLRGVYTGVELDHLTAHGYADRLCYWDVNGSGFTHYGYNSVHDNTFSLSHHAGSGNAWEGADGFQGSLAGTDFYNNFIYGVADNRGTNHQDGWQTSAGGGGGTVYVRIFNNRVRNMGNYQIYFENWASPNIMRHIRIYNNLLEITDPNVQASPLQGISMGNSSGSGWVWDDVVVANNTITDNGSNGGSIAMNNVTGTVTNTYCYNNAIVNGNGVELSAYVVNSNNVRVTGAGANGHFVSYSPLTAGNDLHLISGDTTFKDKGIDLSAYFTTDMDGKTRTGTWAIGAYIVGGADSSPAPPKGLKIP